MKVKIIKCNTLMDNEEYNEYYKALIGGTFDAVRNKDKFLVHVPAFLTGISPSGWTAEEVEIIEE